MARDRHDREDLLAEAKALVERIALRSAGFDAEIVVGFRSDHSASFYFGQDRVYQFTSDGRLRRAFVGQLLYKAEQGRLVALQREPSAEAVLMIRRDLDAAEQAGFLGAMQADLETLHHALAKQHYEVIGQQPADGDLPARICCWLDEFDGRFEIADSPRAA